MQHNLYFDHAATTAVKEEVLKEMIPYFTIEYGNASAMYGIGRNAKRAIEEAREKVAKSINCEPKEIYFTSCGSESDNLAIKGIAYANKEKGNHIITTKIEHHAVIDACKTLEQEGFNVTYLNVNSNGIIDLNELESAITNKTILISVMFANNEIGSIQPIEKIGRIAKKHNIIFHTDSVQAVGNVKIDVKKMNIDLLSMSAHKFYGPKGVGALYKKEEINCKKIQDGGHQEKNLRAGTENVAGIVGMGKAIELANENLEEYNNKLRSLRDYFVRQVEQKIPYIKINGDKIKRLPGNSNISFKFIDGEALLLKLDAVGICASSGSACNTGVAQLSHVLMAIGLEDEFANGTLRITFGYENNKEEVEYLIDNLERIVQNLRNMSPEYLKFKKN